MKKVFSFSSIFILLVSIVCSGIGTGELHKISSLVKHYNEHKSETKEALTVMGFLIMHYQNSSKHKQEEDHDDLPLFHNCCTTTPFILGSATTLKTIQPEQIIELNNLVKSHYSFSLYSAIFQPPRQG
jgi:hypothetical protein